MLPHIVQESSEIRVRHDDEEHVVSLCNLSVARPTTTDSTARSATCCPTWRGCARSRTRRPCSSTWCTTSTRRAFASSAASSARCSCCLPVMLGSQCCHTQHMETPRECRLDQGGYFIVSGKSAPLAAAPLSQRRLPRRSHRPPAPVVSGIPKAVSKPEKLHHNMPYVFPVKQPSRFALQCEIRSATSASSARRRRFDIYITNAKRGATAEMVATLPFVNMNVPISAPGCSAPTAAPPRGPSSATTRTRPRRACCAPSSTTTPLPA